MSDEHTGFPNVRELSAEESAAFVEQEVQKLDDADDKKEKILAFIRGRLLQTGAERLKASKARYRLEIFVYPGPATRIARTIQTILWVNGETMGPGGDQLIHECPRQGCNGLHEPPVKWFTKPGITEWVKDEKGEMVESPVALVACPSCLRVYPRKALTDSRWCTGTWDVLGEHVAKRFGQLRFDADIMKRIVEGEHRTPAMEVVEGQAGAVDRYIRAQQLQQKGCYLLLEDFVRDSIGCDPARYFQRFLMA